MNFSMSVDVEFLFLRNPQTACRVLAIVLLIDIGANSNGAVVRDGLRRLFSFIVVFYVCFIVLVVDCNVLLVPLFVCFFAPTHV